MQGKRQPAVNASHALALAHTIISTSAGATFFK